MRPLVAAIVTAAMAALAAPAAAEPVPAAGYALRTIAVPGAMLSGLSRDGDVLLATDLASGRLLRGDGDGGFAPFGPVFPYGPDVIGDPTGPYRAARVGATLLVAQGWTPVDADPGPYDHALVAVDNAGTVTMVSDRFWNPFDFAVDGGTVYVVDAAANSIEKLALDGGGQSTLFTFARLVDAAGGMQALSPTEFAEGEAHDVDAVPTGIALGPDRRLFVALFGGFPFLEGGGKVVSISRDGGAPASRLELEALNAPVSVAFDAGGRLLVLEHGLYDQATGFRAGTGRLLLFEDGAPSGTVLLDGLTRPASVLVWSGGEFVVSDLGGHLHFLSEIVE